MACFSTHTAMLCECYLTVRASPLTACCRGPLQLATEYYEKAQKMIQGTTDNLKKKTTAKTEL